MRLRFIILFLLTLLVILPTISFSQSSTPQLKYLIENSDAIITGKVAQQKSQWNENKTRIFTSAVIDIEEDLKGKIQTKRVTVNYPGGEVDGVGELYTHTARLQDDEEVLLFIKKDLINSGYNIFEGESGKITFQVDNKTGEKLTAQQKKLSAYINEIKKILEKE